MWQLAKLDELFDDRPYRDLIQNNAEKMYREARNAAGFYGGGWQEPFDIASIGRQASAVHLLITALDV